MARIAWCLLWIVSCARSSGVAPGAASPSSPEVQAIEAVLDDFRGSLASKNADGMLGLFVEPDIPFRMIGSSAELGRSTGDEFAKALAASPTPWEERFRDVKITVDGRLAILDAHYTFLDASVATNDGREIWVLARTRTGWKIASVTWSIHELKPR